MTKRTIFREDAVRRYGQRQQETVLPHYLSVRPPHALWILLIVLVLSGVLTWLVQLPIRVSALAMVVEPPPSGQGVQDEIALAVLLPAAYHTQLHAGRFLFLQFDPADAWLRRPIIAVESRLWGPQEIQQQFKLNANPMPIAVQPATVAIVRLEPVPPRLVVPAQLGSVYQVEVEVGRRRMLSLLPLVNQLSGV